MSQANKHLMNLLLLLPENMLSPNRARVTGRQLQHIHETLKLIEGNQLTVGLLNEQTGIADIISLDNEHALLDIEWRSPPPPALPLTLIIGLPRPKMLKRIVQTASTMGVKELYFIHSWKVEKSFWLSPWLTEEKLFENCVLGLEQAKDTVMPTIHLRKRFKPFVEDELPLISANSLKLLAHPISEQACPSDIQQQTTLIIGPEGGFTPYEVGKLEAAGFETVHLGPRILRVESAVPVLLGRLFQRL
jgi:RsmE family RNA methyltransferase